MKNVFNMLTDRLHLDEQNIREPEDRLVEITTLKNKEKKGGNSKQDSQKMIGNIQWSNRNVIRIFELEEDGIEKMLEISRIFPN
jgi:hypothetical protein